MTTTLAPTAKPHPMQQHHDLMELILTTGKLQSNRTGVDSLFIPGYSMTFDMADGHPATTTKQHFFGQAKGELLGFFRGYQSAADFRAIGCRVWDGNANETKSWLNNKHRKGTDDLGRIYSAQMTDYRYWREAHDDASAADYEAQGYTLIAHDTARGVWVYRKGVNQLEQALEAIMTTPNDRRIMINMWRPDEFEFMSLPACWHNVQFLVDAEDQTLHMILEQRSFDVFLAYNCSIGALFLQIMAKLAGLKAGTLTHHLGQPHLYVNHLDQVRLQLTREHFPQPTLKLGDSVPTLTSVHQIPGVFAAIKPEDLTLEGYVHHPAIRAPMAA